MSKRVYLLNLFKDIADAIRAKTGQTRLYEIDELPDRIMDISTGTTTPAQTKSVEITSNGNQIITPDDGYVLDKVNLSVSVPQNNRNNVLIETYSGEGGCLTRYVETLDLSSIDWSKAISFNECFYNFSLLKSISFPNILCPIGRTDYMFYGCSSLISVDISFLQGTITSSKMFANCYALKSITFGKTFDLSNLYNNFLYDIKDMFYNCKSLASIDLSSWINTNTIKYMERVFSGCSNLKTLNIKTLDTSNVDSFNNLFEDCSKLESLDLSFFDTSKARYMDSMFRGCDSLGSLNLSSWNTNNVTSMRNMFSRNNKEGYNVTFGTNWASNEKLMSFDMSNWNLTHDSALDLLNKLATRTNSPTLKLHANIKALLTADEIKIATDKGWVVS